MAVLQMREAQFIFARKAAKPQRGFETLRTLRSLREPESFHTEFAEDAEKIALNLCVFASLREKIMTLRVGAAA